MLVTMATGPARRHMVNEVYRLMKSGVARRVLFLVDRRALAAQAVRAFASFEAEPGLKFDKIYPVYSQRFQRADFEEDETVGPNVMPNSLLTNPKLGDAFVYVSTIQRMSINLFGRSASSIRRRGRSRTMPTQLDIPIHAFDLIIADECHRGYIGQGAVDLAQHARPLRRHQGRPDRHASRPHMAYFENLAYRYEYERRSARATSSTTTSLRIKSDVRINGVFLHEGEQVDQVDPETGAEQLDLLEDERAFDATEVERKITSPDSNRRILEEIKRYAEEHEARVRPLPQDADLRRQRPAAHLPRRPARDQARDIFGRGEAFVAKITGTGRPATPAHPRVPQPAQPRHRGDR